MYINIFRLLIYQVIICLDCRVCVCVSALLAQVLLRQLIKKKGDYISRKERRKKNS